MARVRLPTKLGMFLTDSQYPGTIRPMTNVLDGIRVLELTQWAYVPAAGAGRWPTGARR